VAATPLGLENADARLLGKVVNSRVLEREIRLLLGIYQTRVRSDKGALSNTGRPSAGAVKHSGGLSTHSPPVWPPERAVWGRGRAPIALSVLSMERS
jgi:hypothetical protein